MRNLTWLLSLLLCLGGQAHAAQNVTGNLTVTGNTGLGTTQVSNAALAVMGGNVGIGTWKPAYPLDINGNVNLANANVLNFTMTGTNRSIQVSGDAVDTGYTGVSFYPSSGTNASASLTVIPRGTGYPGGTAIRSQIILYGTNYNSDATNYEFAGFRATGTEYAFNSVKAGTGTVRPIYFNATGSQDVAGANLYLPLTGNVGIRTSSPGSVLGVLGGASFGSYATTAAPLGGIIASGNVGIASSAPGTALDVQGTARATAFSGPLTGAVTGNATTATALAADGGNCSAGQYPLGVDASGAVQNCTVVSAGSSQWITQAGVGLGTYDPVGIGTVSMPGTLNVLGNVGIGTLAFTNYLTTAPPAGGIIIQGNMGLGTWLPRGKMEVSDNASRKAPWLFVATNGNVGIGTTAGNAPFSVMSGNVGFGTYNPITALEVQGNVTYSSSFRNGTAMFYNGSSQTLNNAGALTADFGFSGSTDSGVRWGPTYASSGTISGALGYSSGGKIQVDAYNADLTLGANNSFTHSERIYVRQSGNVGIGTTFDRAGLAVMNGKVGIGTFAPAQTLTILGNVGISTTNASEVSAGFNGSGATSCICTQFKSGWCVAGSCT